MKNANRYNSHQHVNHVVQSNMTIALINWRIHIYIACQLNMYKGESKSLQYFNKVRHNSGARNDFAEVVMVTNHAELWDATLAWYSSTNIT